MGGVRASSMVGEQMKRDQQAIFSLRQLPGNMPVDMEKWMAQLGKSSFLNAFYQYRDIEQLQPNKNVLIVGPGQGLLVEILKWKNYLVTTIDVDQKANPDLICSVHDMSIFGDMTFDVVVVSHVLEHIPPSLLESSLKEIARIGRNAIIYLPLAGKHFSLRIDFGVRNLSFNAFADFVNRFRRPNEKTPVFCENQHYWEIGVPGYSKGVIRGWLRTNFDILSEYRNSDWPVSYNFVLRSKA